MLKYTLNQYDKYLANIDSFLNKLYDNRKNIKMNMKYMNTNNNQETKVLLLKLKSAANQLIDLIQAPPPEYYSIYEDLKKEIECVLEEAQLTYLAPGFRDPSYPATDNFINNLENIKSEVDKILKNGSEESNKADNNNKFPYKLPAGTEWGNFIIKFEDDENIYIQVKNIKHRVNYKDMGFVGRGKNPCPSEMWIFLKVLAMVNGELTLKDKEAKDKYKKQKELLTKKFQDYFRLEYDLFYPYKSSPEKYGNSYKIKVTLIPPNNKDEKLCTEVDEDKFGIQEDLNECTTQIYDEKW